MRTLLNTIQNGLLLSVLLKSELQMCVNEKNTSDMISNNTWHCVVNREFTQGRRRRLQKRHLKSDFALPQSLSRLVHLV